MFDIICDKLHIIAVDIANFIWVQILCVTWYLYNIFGNLSFSKSIYMWQVGAKKSQLDHKPGPKNAFLEAKLVVKGLALSSCVEEQEIPTNCINFWMMSSDRMLFRSPCRTSRSIPTPPNIGSCKGVQWKVGAVEIKPTQQDQRRRKLERGDGSR